MSETSKELLSLSLKGKTVGENNGQWAGINVQYRALHNWVERKLGKPNKCSECPKTSSRYHWANISKQYKREVSDWIRLCPSCHKLYDTGKLEIKTPTFAVSKEMAY